MHYCYIPQIQPNVHIPVDLERFIFESVVTTSGSATSAHIRIASQCLQKLIVVFNLKHQNTLISTELVRKFKIYHDAFRFIRLSNRDFSIFDSFEMDFLGDKLDRSIEIHFIEHTIHLFFPHFSSINLVFVSAFDITNVVRHPDNDRSIRISERPHETGTGICTLLR